MSLCFEVFGTPLAPLDHVLRISSFLKDPAESLTLVGRLHSKANGWFPKESWLLVVCVSMAGETLVDVSCVCDMALPAKGVAETRLKT